MTKQPDKKDQEKELREKEDFLGLPFWLKKSWWKNQVKPIATKDFKKFSNGAYFFAIANIVALTLIAEGLITVLAVLPFIVTFGFLGYLLRKNNFKALLGLVLVLAIAIIVKIQDIFWLASYLEETNSLGGDESPLKWPMIWVFILALYLLMTLWFIFMELLYRSRNRMKN